MDGGNCITSVANAVANNLVTYIYRHANSRLHFLRQLKRSAVSCTDMLRFYIAVMRLIPPVLPFLEEAGNGLTRCKQRLVLGQIICAHR